MITSPDLALVLSDTGVPVSESDRFEATLPAQFDAVTHVGVSSAVEPLERITLWEAGEPPETYPTGL